MEQIEEGGGHTPKVPITQLRGRPPKPCPTKDGAGNSLLSSPDRGGMDSDGYSMVNKAQSTHHHRRKWQGVKHLVPTYTLWRVNVKGWLDEYQEESMMPPIYNSLREYPSQWMWSLEGGSNLTVTDLLECMDHAFGDVSEYYTMITPCMRLDRRRVNLWRNTCCRSTRLLLLFIMPTQIESQTKGRIWHGICSIMAWCPVCEMPWSLLWQSYLRGNKPVPVLTCCILWLRRWRCVSLHVHTGGSKGLLMPIETSTGDTPLLWGGWQPLLRKICSPLTLNLWFLGHWRWILSRA